MTLVTLIPGVSFKKLTRISTPKGEVRHGLRRDEDTFFGFGEVYFSEVLYGVCKGWKQHRLMTMNLIVVMGAVRFIFHREDQERKTTGSIVLSAEPALGDYGRLTVSPRVWLAFEGIGSGSNLLMNFSSHMHDPEESINVELETYASLLGAPTQPVPQ